MCRKIAFFGLRAEILLARSQGLLDSRAGPFLGSVKKYWFFGEIFTSVTNMMMFLIMMMVLLYNTIPTIDEESWKRGYTPSYDIYDICDDCELLSIATILYTVMLDQLSQD